LNAGGKNPLPANSGFPRTYTIIFHHPSNNAFTLISVDFQLQVKMAKKEKMMIRLYRLKGLLCLLISSRCIRLFPGEEAGGEWPASAINKGFLHLLL
jgi:hypothetical protein